MAKKTLLEHLFSNEDEHGKQRLLKETFISTKSDESSKHHTRQKTNPNLPRSRMYGDLRGIDEEEIRSTWAAGRKMIDLRHQEKGLGKDDVWMTRMLENAKRLERARRRKS